MNEYITDIHLCPPIFFWLLCLNAFVFNFFLFFFSSLWYHEGQGTLRRATYKYSAMKSRRVESTQIGPLNEVYRNKNNQAINYISTQLIEQTN